MTATGPSVTTDEVMPRVAGGPSRRHERRPSSLLWVTAKCLLAGALVAGVVTALLAFVPVRNPNVQDCGTPLGWVVFNRTDVPVEPGRPGAPANARQLAEQPTCRDRVTPRLQQTLIAFGAFLALGLLGAVLGLIDDRIAYHRAPRFESLLRARPEGAPNLLRPPPSLRLRDVGSRLPPIELIDLLLPLVLFALVVGVLGVFAGLDATADARAELRSGPLLLAAVLVALSIPVAGAQLVVSHAGRLRFGTAVASSAAGGWLGRVLPALGPLGLDVHLLVRRGVDRTTARAEQQARQWWGVLAHGLVLGVALVVARGAGDPPPAWPTEWWALAGWTAVVALVGLSRAPDRWRRLVVRPDAAGFGALRAELADPVRAGASAASAVALTLVNALAFTVAVGAVAGGGSFPSFAPLALVYLAAATVALLAPTPAGIGLFEPVAVVGLVWAGVSPAPAVVAVVAYRVVAIGLPVVTGAVASRLLRRAGTL